MVVAKQITPLYQAFNLDQPELVLINCYGHSFQRNIRGSPLPDLRLMCALVVLYEILFVCAGTRSHEAFQLKSETSSPEITFAKKLEKAKATYSRQKARYENKEDKMYQNAWFKAGYVDTAGRLLRKTLSLYRADKYTH